MQAEQRFGSLARLYGAEALPKLQAAHVAVVGVGGVGSWVVEALARSAIGRLTLIDLDDVCVTNVGRQLPALTSTIGQPKIAVLAARIHEINPVAQVQTISQFFTPSTAAELLAPGFTFVVDAIDKYKNKLTLIGECARRKIPVLTCGSAGGRRDPSRVRVTDLAQSGQDELLKQIRRGLRRDYGFPHGERVHFGIPCISTAEPPVYPWQDGTVRTEPEPECALALDCYTGFGAASFVTGTFGFLAAAEVVGRILGQRDCKN